MSLTPSLPGYQLDEVIARGGSATVYRAQRNSLPREVAIKVESRTVADRRNSRRFFRELTALSLLSAHPNVVTLIDSGITADHRPYLVMEYCCGGSMSEWVKTSGALPVEDVLEIAIAISSALAEAHRQGVLHRDIKPANIFIDGCGLPRLGDFGLAKLPVDSDDRTVTAEALTPAFAPPEAFDQRTRLSEASDIWSLAATIYTLVTGNLLPSRVNGAVATTSNFFTSWFSSLRDPTDIPKAEALLQIIAQGLELSPKHRPSADEWYRQLVGLRRSCRDDRPRRP